MTIVVSQGTVHGPGGSKLCACGCGRPRDRAGQRYRRDCATEYMRQWRAGRAGSGMIQRRLTAAEWEAIEKARGALPDRSKIQRAITAGEWAAIQKARALDALSELRA